MDFICPSKSNTGSGLLGLTCYNAKEGLQMLRQNRKYANPYGCMTYNIKGNKYIWVPIYCVHIQSKSHWIDMLLG